MATPDQIIQDARAYVGTLASSADSAIENAISAVDWAGEPYVGFVYANLPSPPSRGLTLTPPTLTQVTVDMPGAPARPAGYQAISAIAVGAVPTFTATAPTLNLPNQPSSMREFFVEAPTIELDAQFPAAPSMILPESPELSTLVAPDKPITIMPAFGATAPVNTAVAPTDLQGDFIAAYREAAPQFIAMVNSHVDAELAKLNPQYHTQMAAIEAQLTRYLAGGTGLAPEVEDAIYARAQSKNDLEAKRVQDAAFADTAARGFTLPGGALVAALARARQDAANNNAKAANEIAIAQAEMEQKNLQFAVTTSTGLRTAMVNATLNYMQNLGQLNGQALDYAKSVLSSLVEAYNTAVKAYSAQLEGYRTEATVFETLMRGALAGVEVYKAEIDALQAMAQVDQRRIDIYRARIDVLQAASNMYKTQVDAVISKASLERLKIDLFQAQVQAFGAEVQAKNSEWQGYGAAIGGEEAKARMFGSQAQAYASQVVGFKTGIEAQAEAIKAQAMNSEATSRQYVAEVSGFEAEVRAKGEVARTELENQRQSVVAFQAQAQAATAQAQVELEYYKQTGLISVENAKLGLQSIVAGVDAKKNYTQLLATLQQSQATIHANLASAALSGMNTLAATNEIT